MQPAPHPAANIDLGIWQGFLLRLIYGWYVLEAYKQCHPYTCGRKLSYKSSFALLIHLFFTLVIYYSVSSNSLQLRRLSLFC
jgi:hypothetical protein